MAIALNNRIARSSRDLSIAVGNSAVFEIELRIPNVTDYTFRAFPEYELYVNFAPTPFGKTLTKMQDWTYALHYDSDPNYVYVFYAENFDGVIELKQNDSSEIYVTAQSFGEERISGGGSHSYYHYDLGTRHTPALEYVTYGEDVSQLFFYACLNSNHSYTFKQQGTNITLANYSNGTLSDAHNRTAIPPLFYTGYRSSTQHGTPMGDRAHLYTIKARNYA